MLDLFINLNHPLEIVDAVQENEDSVSLAQIITHTLMKNIETVEILNLSMNSNQILKKGTVILKLRPVFPLILPVFFIKESLEEMKSTWCESVSVIIVHLTAKANCEKACL